MLNKLYKLFKALEKKDRVIESYKIEIYYYSHIMNDDETIKQDHFANVQIIAMNGDKIVKRFKYGDVSENFNLNSYLSECIEDLSR